MPESTIAVYAKAPEPGNVKTRLVPPLTPALAASLHEAFVRDIVALCFEVPETITCLWTDTITDAWPELIVARKTQISGNLGLKLLHTAEAELALGAERVVIVGSDAPTLPLSHLGWLVNTEADVGFGPAEDGGYYGISIRRTAPQMFDGVRWSGPAALRDSIRACESAGLSTQLGPWWYDVDTPEDLMRLCTEPSVGTATASWLRTQQFSPGVR